MYEIDKMVQDLIQYLRPRSKDHESTMISAINVASIQLDFAKYDVGVDDKELRRIKRLMIIDAETEALRQHLTERVKDKKRYAKKLSIALDRIVAMAGDIL